MLLLPGFNNLAANALIDPFRAANYIHGDALYRWNWVGYDDNDVTASNGLTVCTDASYIDHDNRYDYIVINTSWTPENFDQSALRNWLTGHSENGSSLIGVDTGTFVLGFAGLLKGHQVTVHYEHIAAFIELFPESLVSESLYTIDGNLLTCCGGHAATDLSLEIIQTHHGIDLANASARYIFHERLRSQSETQLSPTLEPVGYGIPGEVREAISLMERNLEEPLEISEISNLVNLSQRQMERLFRKFTGITPIRYYVDVRLDRARGLVTQTQLTIVEIAAACGFYSSENFSRAYKKRFHLSPTRDRSDGRIPFQFRSFPSHGGFLEE